MSTCRTKIVATIGPASDSPELIEELINAGVDVFRIGLAHDSIDTVLLRIATIRRVADSLDSSAAVLVDLPGPKVRAGNFGEAGVELATGTTVQLIPGEGGSTAHEVTVNHDRLLDDLQVGDSLNLGDGRAVLEVTALTKESATAEVLHGGVMRGRPGVHIPSEHLSVATPTPDDIEALDAVVAVGVDMVAVSFVRTARDIRALGLERAPLGPYLVAKIETEAAVENLETILEVSDAVMVARGDLGLECSLPQLPALQKRIIEAAVESGRPVITATQMLETMTDNPQPTRAEVSDVANAVFDGTSAVMLSGETAIGIDPVRVVKTMTEILENAEQVFDNQRWAERVEHLGGREQVDSNAQIADAVSAAAIRAVSKLLPPAIVCVTGSGATARAICRYRPSASVLAVTDNPRTYRQLGLVWGATPILASPRGEGRGRIRGVLDELHRRGLVEPGQIVPVVAGSSNASLASNVLRVETVD
ncbi:MAG: pyruvate kinase [Acidimicrobiales bacterium]